MKKGIGLLSSAAALVMLAACGSSGGASGGDSDKTVVTFWHSMGGQAQVALDQIVSSYNESQDEVYVNAEFQGTYEESLPKFHSVGGTEEAPTIIQVQEIGTMSMINSGHIVPIQPFIDEEGYDMSGLEENIINYYHIDGQFYSMPFNSSTPVMYYNKDAFEAAGLDPESPPETFEGIEEASKKIVEANEGMKGFALQAYGWLFEELLANQGGHLLNNENGRDDVATEVAFDNDKGRSIFEWVERMIEEDTFMNYGTNSDNMVAGFLAGEVAMFMQSSATSRDVIDNAPFDVGVAFIPHAEEVEREGVVIGGASLWMASGKEEAEQEAAWDFMKYLATPEVQAEWHVGTGYFAINPDAYNEQVVQEAYEDMPQLQTAVQQLQSTKKSVATQGALMDMIPEERKIIETALENVFNGTDAQTAFDEAVKQVNAAIEQANKARGDS
ncbi:ABC transporter substrate-binding protein [Shouchella clausii]|uniref:ABC transporter substrate-binding protein n=1 Tax=Shouchella TaxID=2893057 RepID=UPI0006902A48|nr:MULTISPECIES: ABC transporter substrate-binding protein [Shouchella]MBU3230059.1 ABC transporter substrate-binding protein [Shouchella clausii]MBU3262742.1 ABC transporter substrate-binding protein [Shouchella clausii]MBU3506942.1 ABC transporter substrate-binding protein [Shouchella clausii]MBU3535495.1 ABC transporter substrate-binding protein [Shouchella clausii]MBX0306671.1 ABC transporter substrate-binding protein [Shouchella clausii]